MEREEPNDEVNHFLRIPTSSYRPQCPLRRIVAVQTTGRIDRTCDPCLSFMCCDNNFFDQIERNQRINHAMPIGTGLTQQRISRMRTYYKAHDSFRNCSVCGDQIKKDQVVIMNDCGHENHKGCIVPWLTKNVACPVCRYSHVT